MIYSLFSIYDEATEIFNLPFHAINERAAIRSFQQACLQPDNHLSMSPQDFTLYHVSDYNDKTGKVENLNVPVRVITAVQAIQAHQTVQFKEENING